MTYYEILGISETASLNEIRDAYRKRAIEYHPDVNSSENAAKAFLLMRKAYDVLSDPTKRYEYNKHLSIQRFADKREKESRRHNQPQQNNNNKKNSRSLWVYLSLIFALPLLVYIICEIAESYSKSDKITEDAKHPIESSVDRFADTTVFIDENNELHKVGINDVEFFFEMHPDARKATQSEILKDITARREEYLNRISANRPKNGASPYNSFFGKGVYTKSSLSEITIENGTAQDAVVIFRKISSEQIVRNAYVRANSSYTAKQFPSGIYEMKCSFGNGWDSEMDNGNDNPKGGFISDISYSAAKSSDDYFDMTRKKTKSGYNYPTYSVTLHKVNNGNMHTEEISKNDFFN